LKIEIDVDRLGKVMIEVMIILREAVGIEFAMISRLNRNKLENMGEEKD
jgi:hypothetical protein